MCILLILCAVLLTAQAYPQLCSDIRQDPSISQCAGHCINDHRTTQLEDQCKKKKPSGDGDFHSTDYCWAFSMPDGELCYCVCSCLLVDTLVALDEHDSWKPVQLITSGDFVATLGNDGNWKRTRVTSSNGSTKPSPQPYDAILVGNQDQTQHVITTGDHLFVVVPKNDAQKRLLVRADRLSPSLHLLLSAPELKAIEFSVSRVKPRKGFWHISTEAPGNLDGVDGHLLNTAGFLSADFWLQMHGDSLPAGSTIPLADHTTLPIVGTTGHVETNEGTEASVTFKHPYAEYPMPRMIPLESSSFFPHHIGLEENFGGQFVPMDEYYRLKWGERLAVIFHEFAPDVTYELDWYSHNVNAFSWKIGNTSAVMLQGGLLRHEDLGWEAIAVVIARQISSLYSTTALSKKTRLACEYLADYGTLEILMSSFPAFTGPFPYWKNVIAEGVYQLDQFVHKRLSDKIEGKMTPCAHAVGGLAWDCRKSLLSNGYLKELPLCVSVKPGKEEL